MSDDKKVIQFPGRPKAPAPGTNPMRPNTPPMEMGDILPCPHCGGEKMMPILEIRKVLMGDKFALNKQQGIAQNIVGMQCIKCQQTMSLKDLIEGGKEDGQPDLDVS